MYDCLAFLPAETFEKGRVGVDAAVRSRQFNTGKWLTVGVCSEKDDSVNVVTGYKVTYKLNGFFDFEQNGYRKRQMLGVPDLSDVNNLYAFCLLVHNGRILYDQFVKKASANCSELKYPKPGAEAVKINIGREYVSVHDKVCC